MDIVEILKEAVEKNASDIFLVPGTALCFKIRGAIERQGDKPVHSRDVTEAVEQIYKLANDRDISKLENCGDDDFSFSVPGISRFRVSSLKQRGSLAAVIRVVYFELPDYRELHIPDVVMNIAEKTKGFVLVTGSAGSGKSTTLACIIDRINKTRSAHIITLEDPIEYLHKHNKSIVTQREIGMDSNGYVTALRAALRQAPDVILIGEMRDHETIRTAITAAETGHLVISSLHTMGTANTIDRIIDTFSPEQQQQVRIQLSLQLVAIVSQQLVPAVNGGEVPAFEVAFINNAIRNMIRESKTPQIDASIRSASDAGMVSMDDSLVGLFKQGLISQKTLFDYSSNLEVVKRKAAIR